MSKFEGISRIIWLNNYWRSGDKFSFFSIYSPLHLMYINRIFKDTWFSASAFCGGIAGLSIADIWDIKWRRQCDLMWRFYNLVQESGVDSTPCGPALEVRGNRRILWPFHIQQVLSALYLMCKNVSQKC